MWSQNKRCYYWVVAVVSLSCEAPAIIVMSIVTRGPCGRALGNMRWMCFPLSSR
jgi:hypothetical protein